jgi:hypothetical protein
MNLAHSVDYMAAQLNGLGRVPGITFDQMLRTEWIFLVNEMQEEYFGRNDTTNIYKILAPIAAPTCRTIFNTGKPPYSDRVEASMRCFKRAVVGMELFLINEKPQNFTMMRNVLDVSNPCPNKDKPPQGVVIIHRKHEYRAILNIPDLVALMEGGMTVNVIDFTNLTLTQQACTARGAKVLIGMFGAGITWAFNMHPQTAMVQICTYDHKCPWYLNIAKSVRVRAFNYIPKPSEIVSTKFHTVRLEIQRFMAFLMRQRVLTGV